MLAPILLGVLALAAALSSGDSAEEEAPPAPPAPVPPALPAVPDPVLPPVPALPAVPDPPPLPDPQNWPPPPADAVLQPGTMNPIGDVCKDGIFIVYDTEGEDLNVRKLPTSASTLITDIDEGVKVQASGWVHGEKISKNGITIDVWVYLPYYKGWASGRYLKCQS